MLRCEKCQHEYVSAKKYPCSKCDSVANDLFEQKKRTNADHIKSMSIEELAEFLPIVSDFMCKPTDRCLENIFNRGECEKTKECALKWLQSEVEE